jgi:pSer/pThr/pTyr-binding forkhead associated (FHA) protein
MGLHETSPMDAALVMFKAEGERRVFPLTRSVTTLGRMHTCDLRIPLSSVSREHARIEWRDGRLYLLDLGSSNGTFHNDQRITTETPLEAGDSITVGPVHFTLIIDGEPADAAPPQSGGEAQSDYDAPIDLDAESDSTPPSPQPPEDEPPDSNEQLPPDTPRPKPRPV